MNRKADHAPGPSVVVLAPTGRDQPLIQRLLSEHGVACEGRTDEAALLDAVRDGGGPVIVAEEALSDRGIDELCGLLDGQPSWSELPVILLTGEGRGRSRRVAPLERQPSVRFLRRPLSAEWLLALVDMAVEARRRQMEVRDLLADLRRKNRQLAGRAEKLQRLTVDLLEAEDRERRRLAQVLHDDLQQMLVGAGLQVGAAARRAEPGSPSAKALQQVRELIDAAQQRARTLSHELFPSAIQGGDLTDMLEWVGHNAQQLMGIRVDLAVTGELGPVDEPIVRFLYRAVREILCNAAKHGGVESASLTAQPQGQSVRITITDEGVGFDPRSLAREAGAGDGIGLASIRERIGSLGGRMKVASEPGRGSRFTLIVPAAPDVEAAAPAEPTLTIEPTVEGDTAADADA